MQFPNYSCVGEYLVGEAGGSQLPHEQVRVEDEVKFSSPKGVKVFYILKIRYFEKQSS